MSSFRITNGPPGAIELDVYRVSCSIPDFSWPPTFVDLNDARNFIQNHCRETKFRYTGWPNLLAQRFRLFVHYNAAKSALADGMFKVEQEVRERKPVKKVLEEAADGGVARKDEDETKVIDLLASMDETDKLGHDRVEDCMEGGQTADVNTTEDNDSNISPVCSTPSSDTFDASVGTCSKALAEPNKEEAAAGSASQRAAVFDPFEVSTFARRDWRASC